MAQTKHITIRPRDGGRLASGISRDNAGLADYTIKNNFRRTIDGELRREGHDYLWVNMSDDDGKTFSTNPGDQPFPGRATKVEIYATTFNGPTQTGYADLLTGQSHVFEVGELVRVYFTGSSIADGLFRVQDVREDACRTRVTFDLSGTSFPVTGYYSDTSGDPAVAIGSAWSEEPVTLVHMATRPNGMRALIVGTKPRLYKYLALDASGYVDPSAEYIDTGDADYPYWDGNPGEWVVIATGFSMNAQRWEAVSINGWSIFNNGVDLPYSYRVEESEALPLYELREQGIASVGSIAEFGGVLFCGNIKEIKTEALEELFTPDGVEYSARSVASQTGTTVTLSNDCGFTFTVYDVGRVIVFDSGEQAEVTAYTSPTEVEVNVSQSVSRSGFKIYCQASQAGATRSSGVTLTGTEASSTITASSAFFAASMVGDQIRVLNGDTYTIDTYVSPTEVTVTSPLTMTYPPVLFTVIEPDVSNRVIAGCEIFSACMVGRYIVWENTGQVRRITEFIHPTQVAVSQVGNVPEGPFYIVSEDTYGRFTDETKINQVSWRLIWSDYEEPTRFYPSVVCEIAQGSRDLKLKVPSKSFRRGDSVLVAGAGESGGNLTATVQYVSADRFVRLDTVAKTGTTSGVIQNSSAAGSIVGFEDLQDDSSAILRMLELESTLIIYKDTTIFLANRSTGNDAPYIFRRRKIPLSHSLYFRNTLARVGRYHIWAGKDSFYRFDLSTQMPEEDPVMELCKDQFFDNAALADTESIWSSVNAVTKEMVIVTPGSALCYDYLFNTVSSMDHLPTAALTVKRPKEGALTRETEDWFVMGNAAGVVLVYGKSKEPVESWGDASQIYFRRDAYPFTSEKSEYDSTLQSGLGDFGSSYSHKVLRAIQPFLSSRSENNAIKLMPIGSEVAASGVTQLLALHFNLDNPALLNRVNLYFRGYLFGDEILVSGKNNPVEIAGRTYEYTAERTNGTNLTVKAS